MLKPCPFCGSEDLHVNSIYIDCRACGAVGPDATAIFSAEAVWNKRFIAHDPPAIGCEVPVEGRAACGEPAMYEAWWRKRDPFLGTPTGHLVKIYICAEHKTHPFLCANDPKTEPDASSVSQEPA